MHLSVFNPKGGTGKTLLSIQLASAFARTGARVALIDHDPQASALLFSRIAQQQGASVAFVPTNVVVPGFDLYIHDFPPAMQEDFPSRVVVMPTLLDAASFLIFKRGQAAVREMGKTVIPVANRYRSDRTEQRQLVKEFNSNLVIKDRAVYANAYGKGQTVFDSQQAYARHACHEIEQVRDAITSITNPRSNA